MNFLSKVKENLHELNNREENAFEEEEVKELPFLLVISVYCKSKVEKGKPKYSCILSDKLL